MLSRQLLCKTLELSLSMLSNYYMSNTDQEVAEKTRVKKAQYLNDYQQVVEMVDLLYLSRRQTPEH